MTKKKRKKEKGKKGKRRKKRFLALRYERFPLSCPTQVITTPELAHRFSVKGGIDINLPPTYLIPSLHS